MSQEINPKNEKLKFWKGKKVLITGGTSGLGLGLHSHLISLEAEVRVIARTAAPGVIHGDISDKFAIAPMAVEAITQLGHIDVLFNNASSLGPTSLKLLLDTECEEFELAIQTNVIGPFRLIKRIVPSMIFNQFGLVINITSDAAVNPYPKWGAYGSSKAALEQMTRIFQTELETHGVTFLALDPGDMDTPLHLAANPNADRTSLYRPEDSARIILEYLAEGNYSSKQRNIR